MIGYEDSNSNTIKSEGLKYFKENKNNLFFFDENNNFYKKDGMWINKNELDDSDFIAEFIPSEINKANLRIFFPLYSIDSYEKNVKYAVDVCIWIKNVKITLASTVISRNDSLAVSQIINKYGQEFIEYIDINIINPYDLIFGKEWEDFRKNICSVRNADDINHMGSILNIIISPVHNEDNNSFILYNNSNSGQNYINISKSTDYLSLKMYDNHKVNDGKSFILTNEIIYNERFTSIYDYIKKVYNVTDPVQITFELIVSDSKDIYKKIEKKYVDNDCPNIINLDLSELQFDNWVGFHEGMFIISSINIETETNSVIYIISNKIPITYDLFSYLVNNEIKYINLTDINMNIFNINTVNKKITKVVNLSTPEDSKSNIIQPVFFKTRDLANVVIHPSVTENICINLDQYKSKVNSFIFLIEGVSFIEIGRTNSGVIFKIIGSKLPQSNTSGTFYIANENSEIITSGKYNYDY